MELSTILGIAEPIDVAQHMHQMIMELDAELFDSEHRHEPVAQALAAYRDRWVELTETGPGQ